MLAAKKSKWIEEIFAVYNRNLIKRHFHSFQISGLDYLINKDASLPLLIYANHSSWWDGLLAFEISRAARLDSYLMMDEANLRRFFLFRRLGAFSVPKNPRQAIESINYAAALLAADPQRTLWIFPQGEIVPNDLRPLRFFNGAARIVEKVGRCLVVPLVFRLEFVGEFKPEIFVKIGEPNSIETNGKFDSKYLTDSFSKRTIEILNELKNDVINKITENYQKIL